jgi:Flp pilus assembly protein TadD
MSRQRDRAAAKRPKRAEPPRAASATPARPAPWMRLLPLLVVGAGLVAYHDGFKGPFVFDDIPAIQKNPTIRQLSWDTFFAPRSAVRRRPIVNLSLALNYAVGGLDPTSYHAFNLGVHLLIALILLGIVRRTLELPALAGRYGNRAPWLATAVALLWVVHPLISEAVLYVIERTELLMGLFFLLTLHCLLRADASPSPRAWYTALVIAFVLGLGCKEVLLMAPVVLLAYDRLLLAPSFRTVLRRRGLLYASLGLVAVAFATLPGMRIQQELPFMLTRAAVTPLEYARTECGVIVHYLRLAFWPHPLVADYDDWPIATSLSEVLPSALAVAGLVGTTVWACLRRSPLAFVGIWFFTILAPTSSIVPITTEVATERRMYLPLAAVITLVVLAADHFLQALLPKPRDTTRRRVVSGLLVVATATLLTARTIRRSADFRSTVGFWTAILAARPENARAHLALAGILLKSDRTTEALEHYEAAVRLREDEPQARYELGVTLARLGRKDEAVEQYREALRLKPEYAEAHNDLAVVLAARGEAEEAIEHYQAALRVDPVHATTHFNLGVVLLRFGRADEAIAHLKTALELVPGDPATLRALEMARRARGERGGE